MINTMVKHPKSCYLFKAFNASYFKITIESQRTMFCDVDKLLITFAHADGTNEAIDGFVYCIARFSWTIYCLN